MLSKSMAGKKKRSPHNMVASTELKTKKRMKGCVHLRECHRAPNTEQVCPTDKICPCKELIAPIVSCSLQFSLMQERDRRVKNCLNSLCLLPTMPPMLLRQGAPASLYCNRSSSPVNPFEPSGSSHIPEVPLYTSHVP